MSCVHNFEDFWGSGVDKCLLCGITKRSRTEAGVLTHLRDEDGELYPNPAAMLPRFISRQVISTVSIRVVYANGKVENW